MPLLSFITDVFTGLLNVFFFGPASNLDVLYILVPVYINWLVNDYYQERRGTDLGNAAANGFTAIWVGIDWFRTMIPRVGNLAAFKFAWYFLVFKFLVASIVIFYGITIMKYAVTGNKIATRIGRIREVSYVCIVFTPFVYDLIKTSTPSLSSFLPTFIGILLFYPLFYYGADYVLNNVLPAPATESVDDEQAPKKAPPARPAPSSTQPKPAQKPAQPQPRPQQAQPDPAPQRPGPPFQQPQQSAQPPKDGF